MAESESQSCTEAQKQTEQTQNALRPLEQRHQQLQQNVRDIYQEIFACKTGRGLSLAQQQHCTQLEEEGPKQFQSMIEAITLSHRTFQKLTHQIHHAQRACPSVAENIPTIISRLGHS